MKAIFHQKRKISIFTFVFVFIFNSIFFSDQGELKRIYCVHEPATNIVFFNSPWAVWIINTSIVRQCTKFSAAYDSLKVGHNFNFFAESMYNLQFHLLFNLFNFIRLPSSFDFLNTSSVSSY